MSTRPFTVEEMTNIINGDPELRMRYRMRFLETRLTEVVSLLREIHPRISDESVKIVIAEYLEKFGIKTDANTKMA